MSGTSGPTSPKALGFYDPASSSWKTCPPTSGEGSTLSPKTWPKSGMTRRGRLYALPTSGPATAETGSGILATPADTPRELLDWAGSAGEDRWHEPADGGRGVADGELKLLPTPLTSYSQTTPEQWRARRPAGNGAVRKTIGDLEILVKDLDANHKLLPTPTVGNAHDGKLLPTPKASDGTNGGPNMRDSSGNWMLPALATKPEIWGEYAPAIARHEQVFGRPAPHPTVTGARGSQVLSPYLVEWMMGLPEGHVTGVGGLSRTAQLKLLGNGVIPRQAKMAIRLLLPHVLHDHEYPEAA